MDESYDPILPKATKPEPPPLQRLWKTPPEEGETESPSTTGKKKETVEPKATTAPEKPKKKKGVQAADEAPTQQPTPDENAPVAVPSPSGSP